MGNMQDLGPGNGKYEIRKWRNSQTVWLRKHLMNKLSILFQFKT